jgi:hypothetical protein
MGNFWPPKLLAGNIEKGVDTTPNLGYAHYMSNFETHSDQTIYGAFGEFEDFGLPQTDEEWHAYDLYVSEDMAAWDATVEDDYIDFDPEPPF